MSRILEDLTALSSECRRVLPAVREVSERSIISLKSGASPVAGLAPFLIACNHADAPKKVLSLSLSALQRLIVLDIVPLPDMVSIVHVLEIQVRALSPPFFSIRLIGLLLPFTTCPCKSLENPLTRRSRYLDFPH